MTPSPAGDISRRLVAIEDPALAARVVGCTSLRYSAGADPGLDRPDHVRAASSITMIGDRFAIVQDDANFIAVLGGPDGLIESLVLPPSALGERQFDDGRGNKHRKLDLEACFAAADESGMTLFAFGSGSQPARERVAIVGGWDKGERLISVVSAPRLYAALRDAPGFTGTELNVEGAALAGSELWLFQRGNGARRGDRRPVNATCVLDWVAVRAHLASPHRTEPPVPRRVAHYDLGTLGGTPLGFTDAMAVGTGFLYSAAAEASPDAVRDGPVAGSALGVLTASGDVRWAPLRDSRGDLFPGKVEGLAWADATRRRISAVVDHDDPEIPSVLCTIALEGPWPGPSSTDV